MTIWRFPISAAQKHYIKLDMAEDRKKGRKEGSNAQDLRVVQILVLATFTAFQMLQFEGRAATAIKLAVHAFVGDQHLHSLAANSCIRNLGGR